MVVVVLSKAVCGDDVGDVVMRSVLVVWCWSRYGGDVMRLCLLGRGDAAAGGTDVRDLRCAVMVRWVTS